MTEDANDVWSDADDAPELTQEWFDKATLKIGDAVVRHGAKSGKGLNPEDLTLERDGAQLYRAVLTADTVDLLRTSLADFPKQRAGTRLRTLSFARGAFAPGGDVGRICAEILGKCSHPVRAIYFDKNAENNWALGWHQDRTICVQEKSALPGYGPWTRKMGLWHVGPPDDVLAQMITVRIHLDDVGADNAPLLIAAGSHRHGRVSEGDIDAMISSSATYACCGRAGDLWVYSTPILHASAKSMRPARRRVLQVDYAAFDLPDSLQWQALN